MVNTHDFCLPCFDVRDNPAQLAAAMLNYPKLIGPPATDNEGDPTTLAAGKMLEVAYAEWMKTNSKRA